MEATQRPSSGKRVDPFEGSEPIRIKDPDLLWPGLSVLRVDRDLPGLPKGTPVIWLARHGHPSNSTAVVASARQEGGWSVHLVPIWALDDYDVLMHIGVCNDYFEFREGFDCGWFENKRDAEIGTQTRGSRPTWFSRGVVAGFEARAEFNEGLVLDYDQAIANKMNTAIRFVAKHYPREIPHPIGGLY